MLTIGQLADYVGVTVRAIRHYHQRGLLPEPERDASGYRRYGADAVVDLIRIKTLAAAGVPLARIKTLLSAGPEQFAQSVAQIDRALAARIRDLQQQRHRVAELAAGDRLFLPPEAVALLSRLSSLGVTDRAVQLERDGWIVMAARSPDLTARWAAEKLALLDGEDFRHIYLAVDQAFDWDPADPRLDDLADAMVAYAARYRPDQASGAELADDPVTVALLSAQPSVDSPAWQRLRELASERRQAAGRPGG